MPTKNKPKRFNRNRSFRVARRKKKLLELQNGGGRNRKHRPKNKQIKDILEKHLQDK